MQKTNVSCGFSLWKEKLSGVPQYSIYINDILFFLDKAFLSNYADDTALYFVQKNHIFNQSILKKIVCIYRNGPMIIICS